MAVVCIVTTRGRSGSKYSCDPSSESGKRKCLVLNPGPHTTRAPAPAVSRRWGDNLESRGSMVELGDCILHVRSGGED